MLQYIDIIVCQNFIVQCNNFSSACKQSIISIQFYKRLFEIVNAEKSKFKPNNKMQEIYGRIVVLGDCAHSFGAVQNGIKAGNIADFSSFSFHAVKNLTTAEGGAVFKHQFQSCCCRI